MQSDRIRALHQYPKKVSFFYNLSNFTSLDLRIKTCELQINSIFIGRNSLFHKVIYKTVHCWLLCVCVCFGRGEEANEGGGRLKKRMVPTLLFYHVALVEFIKEIFFLVFTLEKKKLPVLGSNVINELRPSFYD